MTTLTMNPTQFTFGTLPSAEAVFGRHCFYSPNTQQGYVILPAKEFARIEQLEDQLLAVTADLLLHGSNENDFEDWGAVKAALSL